MQAFTFSTTKTIVSEPGCLSQLASLCQDRNIARPLIVTDQGIVQTGLVSPVVEQLQEAGLAVITFQDVVADPPETVVLNALQLAKDHGCDGVIGLGGGSSMDVAKLIALLARSEQCLADVYGVGNARGERLPLIQVPTTAGTGSEVTPIAIVTTGETTKQGVVAPQLLPDVALLDADLTLGLPAHVTAATGIDAMVHAIEAYTSRHRKNPYSDMLAREALRLLSANLIEAVENGHNREARSQMLYGAMLAGQAFANAPVAAVHALAYPLGGQFHISHGLSNSLVLPHVLRFNMDVAKDHYTELASCMAPVIEGQFAATAEGLLEALIALTERTGIPSRLRDVDIPESAIQGLAEDAMLQQRLLVNNPRDVTLDDVLAIYQAAY